MFYHVLLTGNCNLNCVYCAGKAFEFSSEMDCFVVEDLPSDLNFDLAQLYSFLALDNDATLTFYGGEPTLKLGLMREILDNAPVKRFMIQTNGLLLNLLEPEYLKKFHTILVSIDGNRELTNYYRGKGVYEKVMENIGKIFSKGFNGELIARMTVEEQTNIFEAAIHLAENENHCFDSIHWQLDANFWKDFDKRNFKKWSETNYIPNLERLAGWWIEKMETDGKVLKLYPFLDTMEDLLFGRKSGLRCGSGYENYSIMADGNIIPCPIMPGMKEYYCGNIFDSKPETLKKFSISKPCIECNLLDFCGGRCLYSNIVQPWPEEGQKMVCKTIESLHEIMLEKLPKVRELIQCKKISLKDFEHLKFNGCEIIP